MLKIIFVLSLIQLSTACNGFEILMENPKNCRTNESTVIKLYNASFTLNEKCEVYSNSCSEIQPYKKALVELKVFKNLMTLSNFKFDVCGKKSLSDLEKFCLVYLGIPLNCPMSTKAIHCYNNEKTMKFSDSAKRLLSMFVRNSGVRLVINISHDTGQSCFEKGFEFIITDGKNCGGSNQVIKMINRSLQLNEKCEISSHSCSEVLPYKSAMMNLKILDGSLTVHQQSYDLCEKKPKPDMVISNMAGWGIPNKCPVSESSVFCYKGNKVATLSPVTQRLLSLFAKSKAVTARILITHDTGTSCFEGIVKVKAGE